jgi:hypothetical protein
MKNTASFQGREVIRRLWPPEPPDWTPTEFTAMLRAQIEGGNAFYEGLPITAAPYNHNIRAEYYSYGGCNGGNWGTFPVTPSTDHNTGLLRLRAAPRHTHPAAQMNRRAGQTNHDFGFKFPVSDRRIVPVGVSLTPAG